ncbi:DICT sensory domain-containing protein [Halosegnis sp.]|uniref:DICT sensory domain-containing protein n=1 Tax=Halosegnis sp. TaxID=2864959 RepID=UPI0035D43B72
MSLSELITGVEDHEKTLTVFNSDADTVETLRAQFGDRNLTVRGESTESGTPESYVVLSQDEEFVTAAAVKDVLGGRDQPDPGFDSESYRPILDHLDETMFTSYDTEQMIAASREIEDRAWRLGAGELYAGFQKLSILEPQMDVYERLSSKDDLSVHAYATPDTESVPDHGSNLTIHVERAEEIRDSWFVVYDGGGDDVNKCALVAEEREPRAFYGFWTYDPETVDWLLQYLRATYGLIEQ